MLLVYLYILTARYDGTGYSEICSLQSPLGKCNVEVASMLTQTNTHAMEALGPII